MILRAPVNDISWESLGNGGIGSDRLTLESGGVLSTTTQEQHALLVLELALAELLDALIHLENLLELLRHLAQALHNLQTALVLARAVLGQAQREHDHAHELRRVRLGGRDADLRASVDVHTAVRHQRDGGAHDVDDTNGQGAALQAVAESHERVGRLAGLGDEDDGVVAEDRRLAVEEVGGQLHRDGDVGQLLEAPAYRHARVEARAAGNEDQAAAATDGADVLPKPTQRHRLLLGIEAAAHGVDDGFRLLEDLLLHEVVEAALHDLLQLDLDGLDGAHVARAVHLAQAVDVELALVDVRDVIVLEVEHLLGVLDDGRGIGGEEELRRLRHAVVAQEGTRLAAVEEVALVWGREQAAALAAESDVLAGLLSWERQLLVLRKLDIHEVDLHLLLRADTDHQWRTLASRHDLTGEVHALDEQTESALELLDHRLDEGGEVNARVLIEDVLGQLRNSLSIRLRLELEALGAQQLLQFLVVCDDAVVHHGELPRRV